VSKKLLTSYNHAFTHRSLSLPRSAGGISEKRFSGQPPSEVRECARRYMKYGKTKKESRKRKLIQMAFNDWVVEVDVEKTKSYYNNYSVDNDCSCLYCENYRAYCEQLLSPALKIGIDPRKEGEFMDLNNGDDKNRPVLGMYHLIGRIISGPDNLEENWNEINLIEIDNYKFGFNRKRYCLPEDFPEPSIQLDFSATTPWLLEIKPD